MTYIAAAFGALLVLVISEGWFLSSTGTAAREQANLDKMTSVVNSIMRVVSGENL